MLVFRRTPRGPRRKVVLYERPGCHLCAETYRALTRVARELAVDIERVDIEARDDLRDRYVLRIPVVAVDARELDAAGRDERELRAFLAPAR